MTLPAEPAPPKPERAAVELIGLLLLIVGVVGLLTTAYLVHPYACFALASCGFVAAGWFMTTSEE